MEVTSTSSSSSSSNELTAISGNGTQDDLTNQFLVLMLAELEHQDPTDPIDSTEYVTQLAQFSQVESLENIRANQNTQMVLMENASIVQSSSLIGKDAYVPSNQFTVDDNDVMYGKAYLEHATETTSIDVKNDQGEVVKTIQLGPQEEGDLEYRIDPVELGLAHGDYTIEVAAMADDEVTNPQTFLAGEIERIHFISASGVMMAQMNNGLGTVSVLDISEVAEGALDELDADPIEQQAALAYQ
ncbi:flagellar hook assembly protein FlgD [Ferrimonas lipolytica]|uniref:Basal-body rod modification protein FlgD n=1 Tax=Ferrimonas lipolytica TaxID=2724191 RepID=A0A6H1UD68_9GAMM|nr:flagellar hook capping FlgD N-terminal domain-containing protein [Ferrimonas lipolytica]QIZ76788.1 flagellar biosynthesis protein FlgD [Ferrimonas lipolytica]